MVPEPPSSENRTFICTVVFLDLVDYSRQPVGQQVALKKRLNELIARSLAHVPESDRLIVDTGDGAALCFFGDPEDALFAATSLREAVIADPGPTDARLRIGINLGPARVVRDLNGNRNVIGDGINAAQRVMGFAAPNQILVSRSYYEVVSHISLDYARLFQYAGLHRDKHIREHEVYEIQIAPGLAPPAGGGRDAARTGDAPAAVVEPRAWSPELLARVAGALARHLGPVATLLVRRAAATAPDIRHLLHSVAEPLPPAGREAFLAETAALTAPSAPLGAPVTAPPEPTTEVESAAHVAGPVTAEVLATAERRLARHLGPIARVLVARAGRDAPDVAVLADRLAEHIADPRARKAFLTEMKG
jgi:hypothetical protein